MEVIRGSIPSVVLVPITIANTIDWLVETTNIYLSQLWRLGVEG